MLLAASIGRHLIHPFGSFLAKSGSVAAVVSPASAVNAAKSDNFDIWHDLDLTSDILKFLFPLKSTH